MLQATASLMAGRSGGGQNGYLSYLTSNKPDGHTSSVASINKRDHSRKLGLNFASKLRQRMYSDTCLKVVYLTCATLISASFIIECILLNLIIIPYISESKFEPGVCKFRASGQDDLPKKCENKCSKERSSFPCLQLLVVFTPFRTRQTNDSKFSPGMNNPESSGTADVVFANESLSWIFPPLDVYQKDDLPSNASYDFESTETRGVYLYDYYSTFKAYKTSRCATSPCHRREEDNKQAVEEFKYNLWRKHLFLCYARPTKPSLTNKQIIPNRLSSPIPSSNKTVIELLDHRHKPLNQTESGLAIPRNNEDAAAILFRLYTSEMFLHGVCWPIGIFFSSVFLLLLVYSMDECQAWVRDETVIA